MNIYIINPYGTLPDEGWFPYRSTCLAKELCKLGHIVTWWTSDFEHREKKKRIIQTKQFFRNFFVRIIPSHAYKKHISISRIIFERKFARNTKKAIENLGELPDCIILAEPSVFYSDIILKLVNKLRCPLIVDVLDLWPELFKAFLPRILKKYANILFSYFYFKRAKTLRCACGFLVVSKDYLKIAKQFNSLAASCTVYLGIDINEFRQSVSNTLTLPRKKNNEKWCIYSGTLGKNYDIDCLINASRILANKNIKIIVVGSGEEAEKIINEVKNGIIFYIQAVCRSQLIQMYKKCDICLAPYVEGSTVAMPLKAFDYLLTGLPIVTSLKGEFGDLLKAHNIGVVYKAGDSVSLANAIDRCLLNKSTMHMNYKSLKKYIKNMDYSKQYNEAARFIETTVKNAKK